ncbi:hypothetical protein DAKH74_012190 [Maudiozyma humilis]|uniref:C2H2-type domain-containing protein n=1 Tax=Maudiozyma humilis TaxID=51915 RepID=A0AAV5RT65_MAUHU|nr:hypothetical protein DAKH74_012190 [Kazachstania humilis]
MTDYYYYTVPATHQEQTPQSQQQPKQPQPQPKTQPQQAQQVQPPTMPQQQIAQPFIIQQQATPNVIPYYMPMVSPMTAPNSQPRQLVQVYTQPMMAPQPHPQMYQQQHHHRPSYPDNYSPGSSAPGTVGPATVEMVYPVVYTSVPYPGAVVPTVAPGPAPMEITTATTTAQGQPIPAVPLPPISSVVSQIKPSSSSCPDISQLAAHHVESVTEGSTAAATVETRSTGNRNSIPYLLRTPTPQVSRSASTLQKARSSTALSQVATPGHQRIASGIPVTMTTVMKLDPNPALYVTTPSSGDGRLKQRSPTLAEVPGHSTTNEQLRRVSRATVNAASPDSAGTMHTIPVMKTKGLVSKKGPAKKSKQCPVCGKVCSRPSTLKTHFLIHTGDNPFKCTWEGCEKRFNVKSNMQRHVKSHQRKLEKMARKEQEMLRVSEMKKQLLLKKGEYARKREAEGK